MFDTVDITLHRHRHEQGPVQAGRSHRCDEVSSTPTCWCTVKPLTHTCRVHGQLCFTERKEGDFVLESVQVWSLPFPLRSLNCGKDSLEMKPSSSSFSHITAATAHRHDSSTARHTQKSHPTYLLLIFCC